MSLFAGVGPRIAERMILLGYVRPDGKPDVRRFCRKFGYDKTIVYYWLRDRSTPVKELPRLAQILQVPQGWLLTGEGKPKKPSAIAGGSDQADPPPAGKRLPKRGIMSTWAATIADHVVPPLWYPVAA